MAISISGSGIGISVGQIAIGSAPAGYTLWTWGGGSYGKLGLEDVDVNKSSPIQIGALADWTSADTGGRFSFAAKNDGSIWTWGHNSWGQLGQGDQGINRSSPVQVGALTNWSNEISAGRYHCMVIKTDGTLWTWGLNTWGQLGDGTQTMRSSPSQIGSLTNWARVEAGFNHSQALKTDGTLWSWGLNDLGQLGNSQGYSNYKSSPVQVGSLTSWIDLSNHFGNGTAIRNDGTLWIWGNNSSGQLGDGTRGATPRRSSPIQVGALNNWADVSITNSHVHAVKTDGTLWGWGDNLPYGNLGDGTTVRRSSPVQIGGLTNWASADPGDRHTTALKTDGTLWSWGRNNRGQLGDGTASQKNSPVQIGSLTDWVSVSTDYDHSLALKST